VNSLAILTPLGRISRPAIGREMGVALPSDLTAQRHEAHVRPIRIASGVWNGGIDHAPGRWETARYWSGWFSHQLVPGSSSSDRDRYLPVGRLLSTVAFATPPLQSWHRSRRSTSAILTVPP
jgi:hypothetical protein